MENIGLIGAGVMGTVAAQAVMDGGYEVFVFDPSLEACEKLATMGAKIQADVAAVTRLSEIILMFLPGPKQIEAVVTGSGGIMENGRNGQIIVDHATSDPETTRHMAALLKNKGIGYLDAPVLGRPSAIGSWALPIGGDAEDLETCRPVLELMAKSLLYIGESGAGHTIKLLNQMMFGAINAMTAEMMAVADKLGVEPAQVYKIITSSQAGTVSNLFKELGLRISEDRFDSPTFSINLLIKDVLLGLKMARKAGLKPILGETISQLNEKARNDGYGDLDTAIMWKSVANK
jgi:3-hydroxyisobutyrate dehydrogenase